MKPSTKKKSDEDQGWTSLSSWSEWVYSFGDKQAWAQSINSWCTTLNMLLEAHEVWKIDWEHKQAASIVENVTMRWTVAVDEYSQIVECCDNISESLHDTKTNEKDQKKENNLSRKCLFVKRLYVNPFVTFPRWCLDSMAAKYKQDSDTQMKVICDAIQHAIFSSASSSIS